MKSGDIKSTQKNGQRINTPYSIIYSAPTNRTPQVACIVSKKVAASAVRRHKLQRWLRELTRELRNTNHLQNDLVWIAKPSLNNVVTLEELRQSLDAARDTLLAAEGTVT